MSNSSDPSPSRSGGWLSRLMGTVQPHKPEPQPAPEPDTEELLPTFDAP
jgi:hypothetical protein